MWDSDPAQDADTNLVDRKVWLYLHTRVNAFQTKMGTAGRRPLKERRAARSKMDRSGRNRAFRAQKYVLRIKFTWDARLCGIFAAEISLQSLYTLLYSRLPNRGYGHERGLFTGFNGMHARAPDESRKHGCMILKP